MPPMPDRQVGGRWAHSCWAHAKARGADDPSQNHLNDEALDWIALVAKPFGKAFLRRRHEILQFPRGATVKFANLTFSKGADHFLFENRIGELNEYRRGIPSIPPR